jgi:hypothetical protein
MLGSEEMQRAKAEASDWGVPPAFADRARAAMETLRVAKVTLQNVWIVFSAILQLID